MARSSDPRIRQRILEEAEHVIHLKGFHCASLDEIAGCCGMTKANLFHHFQSKEELGLAVLEYKMRAYHRACVEPLMNAADPALGVERLFTNAAAFFRGNGCKAGCFVGNIALEMSDLNDRFRALAGRFFSEWTDNLAGSLRRARLSGALGPGLRPRATAEAVLALYEGTIMLAKTLRDPAVFSRVGREARGLIEAHRISAARRVKRNTFNKEED